MTSQFDAPPLTDNTRWAGNSERTSIDESLFHAAYDDLMKPAVHRPPPLTGPSETSEGSAPIREAQPNRGAIEDAPIRNPQPNANALKQRFYNFELPQLELY